MQILFYAKLYFTTFLVFLAIDFVWLTKVAPTFYKTHIGHLMSTNPNFIAAGLFYVINIIGLMIFTILPALNSGSYKTALVLGGLYGLMTYATYDLTNLATLKNWPVIVTIVDLAWGITLSATVSVVSYYIGSKLN